ncbi:class I SAM-dependent methyltransferase [Seonamhaeicola sediminis]|uniref:Class I SAM-dependent methyltransferase n=1 Tax=Seonamhaeicola sediminis TaxID=2528206 RepID=A0A562YCB9_9FLAO|nr:class I SAM-dependent methyltransferase [Seonamhaeicola sediminis]TWO31735.1 class I SAM-dependent methyltransferase [Seonamhaeicola sediminis]
MVKTIRNLYYKLSVKQRFWIRKLVYYPTDLFRDRSTLIPPKGMIYTGSGDFIKIGNSFFNYFKEHGNITPESTVLDIGSGIGRIAIPFTKFLNKNGSYEGFDVVKKGVNWCSKNISSKYPNFSFKYISLKNDLYNTSAENNASNFVFPYEANVFDFAFLISVFTHMLPNDLDNYLNEIIRVLKPNKKCIATFFILDEISSKLMNNSEKNFKYNHGHYSLMSEKVKEANVAYSKDYLISLIESKGFVIEKLHEGNWSGRDKTEITFSTQDILILRKK